LRIDELCTHLSKAREGCGEEWLEGKRPTKNLGANMVLLDLINYMVTGNYQDIIGYIYIYVMGT